MVVTEQRSWRSQGQVTINVGAQGVSICQHIGSKYLGARDVVQQAVKNSISKDVEVQLETARVSA